MADEQNDQPTKVDIGTKLKDVFTSLKPKALSIVKFWQGIVDLVVRASVALLALLVFIMGCAMGNDPGARVFDQFRGGGSRMAVGGWTAFLAFVILVIQGLMIALRFLNFAAAFRYPVLVVLVDAIYSGVAFGLVLLTSFIPAAVYAAEFAAFGTADNDQLTQNIINTSTGISGTLAFFGFLLVVGLIAQLVWALLWYFLKWYKALKSKYEYSAEGAEADYKE